MIGVGEVAEQVEMVLKEVLKKKRYLVMTEVRNNAYNVAIIDKCDVLLDGEIVHVVGKINGKTDFSYPLDVGEYGHMVVMDKQGNDQTDLYDEDDETEVELDKLNGVKAIGDGFTRYWT